MCIAIVFFQCDVVNFEINPWRYNTKPQTSTSARHSTEIQLSIQGLLVVMGKPIRKSYLSTVKHD